MQCGKTSGIMACLTLIRVVIHQMYPAVKVDVHHLGNLHRVHLRISNVCNFLLVNEDIKCG